MIPIAQPILTDEEANALVEVLNSKILVQGPKVAEFERGFAGYCSTGFGIATSSGTSALAVCFMAAGLKAGDEVITSPFSFIATATSIIASGATPVFVDVDPDTFNLDPELVADAVTTRTKAILPVHLYGLPAEMDELNAIASEHDLWVVEDACQSHGAEYRGRKVGNLGDAGVFSFYPTKNITTGEGGMITTNDEQFAQSCRLLRNHGQRARYDYATLGYNFRMTELAAAIGLVQLPKLEDFNARRRSNAKHLNELLSGKVATPEVPEHCTHVFHQYTIRLKSATQRDNLNKYLRSKSIGSEVYYPLGLHEIGFLNGRVCGNLANTEKLTKTVLSLPVHPALSTEQVETVGSAVLAGLSAQG